MYQVDKNLYRGPRPKSFKYLKEKGITVVVDFQSGVHEKFNNDAYEFEDPSDFGIKVIKFKMSDVFIPNYKDVSNMIDMVFSLTINGEVVYFHCLHGKDRTGWFAAGYSIRHKGYTYEEAVKEMFEYGFHKIPYIYWVPSLKKFSNK